MKTPKFSIECSLSLVVFLILSPMFLLLALDFFPKKPLGNFKIVRNTPLKSPLFVREVLDEVIVLENDVVCKFAGIKFPKESKSLEKTKQFIRIATKQGVEIVKKIDDYYLLRCEPRFYPYCLNDPIDSYYEPFLLNELLIVGGYADFEPSFSPMLSKKEISRLKESKRLLRELDFYEEGISIRGVRSLNLMLEEFTK